MNRTKYLKETLGKTQYLYMAIAFVVGYYFFYYAMMSYFNNSFGQFLNGYTISYLIPAIGLNIVIGILLGITAALTYRRFHYVKNMGSGSFFSAIGIFGTALATGCPGCIVGFFPFVLSLFGVTASLSSLPFNGLEVTLGSAALLGMSVFTLSKKPKMVCKIK
jgi:hypothetical protein